MEDLVKLMKDKQELRGIDDAFVKKVIDMVLNEYPGIMDKYEESRDLKQFTRSIDYKILLKETRAKLREVYGVFIMEKYKKIKEALEEVKKNSSEENHEKMLEMHRSSKERLPYYGEVYKRIFATTGKPKRILDLACGLNPFSYPFLGCEPEYLASDISPVMCKYINSYFEAMDIEGQAFVFDLLEFEKTKFAEYAESDVCFLFKALDSLESIERCFSEKLINGLPAKHIVVSFPKQSIGGGSEIDERGWFERMIRENNWECETFEIENEMFYVIRTS